MSRIDSGKSKCLYETNGEHSDSKNKCVNMFLEKRVSSSSLPSRCISGSIVFKNILRTVQSNQSFTWYSPFRLSTLSNWDVHHNIHPVMICQTQLPLRFRRTTSMKHIICSYQVKLKEVQLLLLWKKSCTTSDV